MTEGIVLSMILTSHVGWEGKFNEVHPSISYEYKNYSVGVFRNSLDRTSVFVSKIEKFEDFSVQYGLASNYNNKTVPMVVLRRPLANRVNFILIPSYETKSGQPMLVVGLEARY